MRTLACLAAILVLALPALAASDVPSRFGEPGAPRFDAYEIPGGIRAAEPSIGIPWDTDHAFIQAISRTFRAAFDDNATDNTTGAPAVQWTEVTPPFVQVNLDPLLVADPVANRVFAGGLAGPCSVMGISDDNGESWTPTGNMCSGARFDHQSLGVGPWAPSAIPRDTLGARATYYCAQLGGVACATGLDGGRTWLPWVEVSGSCGGFHGHIKVSEVNGLAVLPFARCGQEVGFAYTEDNGVTWPSRTIPGASISPNVGFDPSVHFTTSGWMYYSHSNDLGIYVGLTKDGGLTWETLGGSTPGVQPATWLNLSAAFQEDGRPLRYANFVNVVAGDDDRAALTFLGTTSDGTRPWECVKESDTLVWHYYLAQTFDAGQAWSVVRLSEDPVQIGGIYDSSTNNGGCRNLLDFNDANIDSKGRIHIAFADGCVKGCADSYAAYMAGEGEMPEPSDSRTAVGYILRQTTGRGVFAAHDVEPAPGGTMTATFGPDDQERTPWAGLALVMAGLVAAAWTRRK